MRALLVLSLLAAAAAHECPIIDWLKEHGAEVLETVKECKDVPSAISRAKEHKECYAHKSVADKAAVGIWYAITGLEHMNGKISQFAKNSEAIAKIKSFATAKVISMAHEGLDKFCGSDECMGQVEQLQSTISSCYASVTCDFMGKVVPFETCKPAVEKYMLSTMNVSSGSMCASDTVEGQPFYCGELNADLMFKDYDCFIERMTAAQKPDAKCTPKCVQEWQTAKAKMPKCSNVVSGMTQQIYENVRTLLEDIASDAKMDIKKILDNMPKHLPTYEENCKKKELQSTSGGDMCTAYGRPCDPQKDRCTWSESKDWHCLPKNQCPDCCYCVFGSCGCAHYEAHPKSRCMWSSSQDWHCRPTANFNATLLV